MARLSAEQDRELTLSSRYSLRLHARCLKGSTIAQKEEVSKGRQRLQKKIERFHAKANSLMEGIDLGDVVPSTSHDMPIHLPDQEDNDNDDNPFYMEEDDDEEILE